jgi:hypothetical protein
LVSVFGVRHPVNRDTLTKQVATLHERAPERRLREDRQRCGYIENLNRSAA